MDTNLRKRIEKLEAGDPGSEAMRTAVESFAGKLGIDLSLPGVRPYLESEALSGRIIPEGGVTWQNWLRISSRLSELAPNMRITLKLGSDGEGDR